MTPSMTRATTVAAALLVWLASTSASAQTASEIACRDAIAKTQSKYVSTLLKTAARCHQNRSAGKVALSIDCNDVSAADLNGKNVKTANKLRAFLGGAKNKCPNPGSLIGTQYVACPDPALGADDGGASTGIDNVGEVADCLVELDNGLVAPATLDVMGAPVAVLGANAASCQKALGRALEKHVKAYGRTLRKCQNTIDKQGAGTTYQCGGTDPGGKLGRSLVKLNDAIVRDCSLSQAELAEIGACADTTQGLRDCVGDIVATPLGEILIAAAYELQGVVNTTTTTTTSTTTTTTTTTLPGCGTNFPTCDGECPSGTFCTNTGSQCSCEAATGACEPATIRRIISARFAPGNAQTNLSVGFSGTAHDIDVPHLTGDSVDVNCDANCENCAVTLNPARNSGFSNCRCVNNPQVRCDTINAADVNDCGAANNLCQCSYGSPLPISSGGTPVCAVNTIRQDHTGTMNLRTGEWFDTLRLASLVHLGISQFAPCPTCDGDVTLNDGVRNGTCNGGLQNGASCDGNGDALEFGVTSHDCPPAPQSNISGSGLLLKLPFTTNTSQLDYNLPCDAPFPAMNGCPCRVCSGDNAVGCRSNADCAPLGAGDCTAGGGAGVLPHECDDIVPGCDNATSRCATGPDDTLCDGATHSDGRGYIACITDADCQVLGAGNCTITEKRRCFPNPIVVTGVPDTTDPIAVATFCIPPTTSAAVNASGGLPGAGTFETDFEADVRCQSNPAVPYQFPDGANCVTVTTTTTTTLPTPCALTSPPMCNGTCPMGTSCQEMLGACICM